jgi:acyl carrier protein phosphodiesterase
MAHRSGLTELADGAKSLAIHYDNLHDGFARFYPDLQLYCLHIKKRKSS